MIYKIRGHYCISSHGCWLPGFYETKATAQYAFQFGDGMLWELQESVNPRGIITMAMLKEAKKKEQANERETTSTTEQPRLPSSIAASVGGDE